MSAIEQRARELLAAEHRKCDRNCEADLILAGDVTALGQIALNAISAALAPQWLPIESAPKDGRAILVMRNNWPGCKNGVAEECNGHNTYVAEWWAGERHGEGGWICYMHSWVGPECPVEPTHWQPLPPPPEVKP